MSLDLVDQGSLTRPGPIGRILRLTLGIACLYGLWELIKVAPDFVERPLELLPNLSLMVLLELCGQHWIFQKLEILSYPRFGIDYRRSGGS